MTRLPGMARWIELAACTCQLSAQAASKIGPSLKAVSCAEHYKQNGRMKCEFEFLFS